MHMPVVRYVDQELFAYLVLNPFMEHRNQDGQFHGLGVLEIELDVDMLQFHVPFPEGFCEKFRWARGSDLW
jgi:hypothetical protein